MHRVGVKCYSGYTYPEEPRGFEWGGTFYEVKGIESAWREPGKRFFRVRTGDNALYNLCYNELHGDWTMSVAGRSEPNA